MRQALGAGSKSDESTRRPGVLIVANQQQRTPAATPKVSIQTTQYQGPIPSPEALEHYERVSSGVAPILVGMAEN
jgi:hypothetical protein